MSAAHETRRAASRAGNSRALTTIARIGFAASGIMHLLMGYLALRIANHQGAESDQSGAFTQLTKLPGGAVIVWIAIVGFAALALWLLLQAALGIGSASKKRWARSLVSMGKAVAYFALASTAFSIALRHPTDSATSAQQASRTILSLPGGQLLLTVAGIVTAGIGAYLLVKGIRRKFHDDIDVPTGHTRTAVEVLGITGYVTKGIAIVTLGILFITAAIQVDPEDASGLDGAVKTLVALPFGEVIVLVIAIGLIAYGLYSFARTKLAKL